MLAIVDRATAAARALLAEPGAGENFATAGPPHPTAAARARAAAEQLPTVGRWPGGEPSDGGEDEDLCPIGDPSCYAPADACHDACEPPAADTTREDR